MRRSILSSVSGGQYAAHYCKTMPGRTEQQKVELARRISKAVKKTICSDERSISVSFEDVASDKWMDEFYTPDILMKRDLLYKKPEYGAFENEWIDKPKLFCSGAEETALQTM